MTIAEFTERLYSIFKEPSPAKRYTIVKCKRRGMPISRVSVRVFRK